MKPARATFGGSLAALWFAGMVATGAHGADPDSAANEIRILQIQGVAEIMPAGATTWIATQQTNQVLHPGDRLRTGNNSRVTLRWSHQSIVPVGALTELEVLPPDKVGSLPGMLFKGLISFFHRDTPGRIQVRSRGASAGVKGTEFVMEVTEVNGEERVMLAVIDGQVELSNTVGSVSLTNHQQGVIEPGRAPARTAGFMANNLLQWCFYYPGVLDLADLALSAEEMEILKPSLDAYRAGDLLGALASYPAARQPTSDAERIFHAALLLSVGQVAQTEAELASLPADQQTDPLAESLRTLIAAVKRSPKPSAVQPQLSTELLAASYHEQSLATGDASLKSALELARRATTVSPQFGFAWERVAELEFGFGRTAEAAQALDQSLALSPRNAQALALKGFLLAARHDIREAMEWFERAIATDAALGNAWLGRGLCRIRAGDRKGGREDLLVAAALEPQRALLRSYLGKAFTGAGAEQLAGRELGLAKTLDPADPTAWLYSALFNQQQNRLNEAIRDLEQSSELNDNRALFRSRLLLDKDRAVRSTSLASIYRDAGMADVSLREAARAITYDYANHSAHLFLANSFDALRDPTRFNLRYETPWFNELLLANLLSPVGGAVISPHISQQEYSRLFESDGLGLATTTDYRSDGQVREVASQFGAFGRVSYSLDLDWQHNDGVRPNNDLSRTEWYSQIKVQLTPRDSLFVLTKYEDYHSGDNFQYFDPNQPTVQRMILFGGPLTITNATSFSRFFRYDEDQQPIVIGAYHREWAPGLHTLALGGRLINDQHFEDKSVPLYYFRLNPFTKDILFVSPNLFDVDYRSQFEIWIAELNQIVQTYRNTLILGGRFQTGQFDTSNSLSNAVPQWPAPDPFPPVNTTVSEGMQRWSVYGYDTFELFPSQLWLTAGLAYDRVDYPSNFRQVPISSGQSSADCLGPKASLVWSPTSKTTLRLAYARSLGGVSFDESFRLEPPQLAGFNQSYRTIIPESVAGSVAAPTLETIGAALDLKVGPQTYIGLVGEALSSDVDRVLGVYRFPVSIADASFFASSTPQQLRYDEHSGSISVNQLWSKQWSSGATYKFSRSELDQSWPEVPLSAFAGAREFDQADLHTVSLYLLYNHPSGFFARAEADWYMQDRRRSIGGGQREALPSDDFWQAHFWVGYRLRRGRGDLSVGLLNATGTDYRLDPLNPYSELPRERVAAVRLRLRF